jgi:hypothetical protein
MLDQPIQLTTQLNLSKMTSKKQDEFDLYAPVPPGEKRNLQIAGAVVGSCILGIVGLTAPFVLSKSALPYMATPGPKLRRALQHLEKGKNGVFVDLGSGDGEAVYQAARLGYRAVGIELNFTLWALSTIRRQFFWSAAERERSTFLWKNFFDYNLKDANTVMIFGVTPLMKSLSQKIAAECNRGTDVLSYRFAIPLAYEQNPDLLKAEIVYDEQEMRIYRCK